MLKPRDKLNQDAGAPSNYAFATENFKSSNECESGIINNKPGYWETFWQIKTWHRCTSNRRGAQKKVPHAERNLDTFRTLFGDNIFLLNVALTKKYYDYKA